MPRRSSDCPNCHSQQRGNDIFRCGRCNEYYCSRCAGGKCPECGHNGRWIEGKIT